MPQVYQAPHQLDSPRPNVLFEAGLAVGRSHDRTILVEVGKLRPFSDIGGRHTIRLDNSPQKRQDLANRLGGAGCVVDVTGSDWYSAGDFSVTDSVDGTQDEVEEPALRVEPGKEESTGTMKRGWGLTVWNDGIEEPQRVHANLEAIVPASPMDVSFDCLPTNCDLHWARQIDDETLAIPASQSRRLNVLYYDRATNHLKLSYHRTTEEYREDHKLFFDFPILILINIIAERRAPVFAVCRIDPKPAASQIFQGLSKTLPFELLWYGTHRRSLNDFQREDAENPD